MCFSWKEFRVIQKFDWVRKEGVHLRKQEICGKTHGWKVCLFPQFVSAQKLCACVCLCQFHSVSQIKWNGRHLVLMTDGVYIQPQSGSHQAVCGCKFRQVSIHFVLNNFCVMAGNGNWKAKMCIFILKHEDWVPGWETIQIFKVWKTNESSNKTNIPSLTRTS